MLFKLCENLTYFVRFKNKMSYLFTLKSNDREPPCILICLTIYY